MGYFVASDVRRRSAPAVLAVAVIVVLLGGCGYWRQMTPRPALSHPAGGANPSLFDYQRHPVEPSRRLEARRDGYRIWHLDLPSAGDNAQPDNRLLARYYESETAGPKRLIVALPIYGKSAYPSRKIAHVLTRRRDAAEVEVLQLLGDSSLYDWRALAAAASEEQFLAEIDRTGRRMVTTVVDVRRLLDWAVEQPGVDPERIGIVGFSFSSILAHLTMAVDERVAAGVFFMGGGHLDTILARCHGNDLARARERAGRRLGWTRATFERKLERPLRHLDPVLYGPLVGERPVLLADAKVDRVIPADARLDLRRSLPHARRLGFLLGHRSAFLTLTPVGGNWSTRRIRSFFYEEL